MVLLENIRNIFASPVQPYVETGENASSNVSFTSIFSAINVGNDSAMTISAFYDGVNTISDDLAQLPISILKKENKIIQKVNHPAENLIANEPSNEMTSFTWRKRMIMRVLVNGNSITRIHRNENTGRIDRLEEIEPSQVHIFNHNSEQYYYLFDTRESVHNSDIIHIRNMATTGKMGKSVISYAAESMGVVLAAQKFGKQYFEASSNPTGVIEAENRISPTAKSALKDSWNHNYSGNGPKGVALLDEGMKYKKISITPEEAQFIATRKFGVTEIARWLKIPPHKLKDLEKSAFSNIEQQNIDYVVSCLIPWVRQIEQELRKKLFTTSEKQNGYYVKINLNGLLRGDLKTRAQFYKDLFYIGAMSPNEVRELEDLNPRDGGEEYFTPVNMQTVDQIQNQIKQNNE